MKGNKYRTMHDKKNHSCPHCGAPVVLDPSNPYRPFCCKRCKMADLGAWLREEYRIACTILDSESDNSTEDGVILQ